MSIYSENNRFQTVLSLDKIHFIQIMIKDNKNTFI